MQKQYVNFERTNKLFKDISYINHYRNISVYLVDITEFLIIIFLCNNFESQYQITTSRHL